MPSASRAPEGLREKHARRGSGDAVAAWLFSTEQRPTGVKGQRDQATSAPHFLRRRTAPPPSSRVPSSGNRSGGPACLADSLGRAAIRASIPSCPWPRARRRYGQPLLVDLLACLTLQFGSLALGLHLLVVDNRTRAVLDRACDLFDLALRALGSLGGFDAHLSFELLGLALDFHLLVTDHLASDLFDLAADLLRRAFALVALVAHWKLPPVLPTCSNRCASRIRRSSRVERVSEGRFRAYSRQVCSAAVGTVPTHVERFWA